MGPEKIHSRVPSGLKRAAVFCIIQCGQLYLLLIRSKSPYQGKFVPVGGKVDACESPYDAVIREVREETGMHISYPEYCGTLTETSPVDYNWISFIYKVQLDEFLPAPPCDEGQLVWVHENDLVDLDMPPTDQVIYEFAKRNQKFAFQAVFSSELQLMQMTDDLTGLQVEL
ncbi:MAG: NUDIX domain-containing protein [Saprospiraceae bacterium]|jgi:8-oxo-dGTP diphosphatase|nr:NUDIX domain-containing protein [Saprospiraceae bacterium]